MKLPLGLGNHQRESSVSAAAAAGGGTNDPRSTYPKVLGEDLECQLLQEDHCE